MVEGFQKLKKERGQTMTRVEQLDELLKMHSGIITAATKTGIYSACGPGSEYSTAYNSLHDFLEELDDAGKAQIDGSYYE
mgnify:FL=1